MRKVLIIGLGNPGERYQNNRHNAGHKFVEWLVASGQWLEKDVKVIKTDTFMNDSGSFVKKFSRTYKLEPSHLFVAHDDLDIPLGQYKIQKGVGPKVHNGILSVEKSLNTKDFWRIRIGVDNRDPQNRAPGEDYVLQDFTKEELSILHTVFDAIIKECPFQS